MKRLWLLTAVLLLVPLQGQESDPFLDKMIAFDKVWNQFQLEYLGCPHTYTTDSSGVLTNCSGTGSMNVTKLNAAKRAAMKLFHLVPEPQ